MMTSSDFEPRGLRKSSLADDIAVVVVNKHLEELEHDCNEAIGMVQDWLVRMGLQLAEEKTEVVLISSRRVMETIRVTVGDHEVASKPELKYLGITLDARLTYKQHLQHAAEKAARATAALARIMPNIGGPKQKKRLLLGRVAASIMLYGSQIWASAMKTKSYRKKTEAAYRTNALRVCSAFRTTSYDAACVLAGMVPIDLLAKEAQQKYRASRTTAIATSRGSSEVPPMTTLEEWQERWCHSDKGRWTHRVIPNIDAWINRKHGELNFYLTQMLTGHGCFRAYLHRFGHDDNPYCPTCTEAVEDAEHIMFHCPRYHVERQLLVNQLGEDLTPDNFTRQMTSKEEAWEAVSDTVTKIMKEQRRQEQQRNAAQLAANMNEPST